MGEEKSEEVNHDPQLCYLLVISLGLLFSVWLTWYGVRGLSELNKPANAQNQRRQAIRAGNDRDLRQHGRRSYLHLLAMCVVVSNDLFQLVLFEYYVLQRILMRGYSKQSPMFLICRANFFLFWFLGTLPFLFVFWFWLELLISTFVNGTDSLKPSNAVIHLCYALMTLALSLAATTGTLNAIYATEIVSLKTVDVNVYGALNDNMTVCHIISKVRVATGITSFSMALAYAIVSAMLLQMYVQRLRKVVRNVSVRQKCTQREQLAVHKSTTMLVVIFTSTVGLMTVAWLLRTWTLVGTLSAINSSAVIFYFQFSQQYYDCFCGWIHRGLLAAIDTKRKLSQRNTTTLKAVYSLSAADKTGEIQLAEL